MALCNRRISDLQSPKFLLGRIDVVLITLYVLLVFPYLGSGLHFDFPSFDSEDELLTVTEGAAYRYPGNKTIRLTRDPKDQTGSIGRLRYRDALHLWDGKSNTLADFTTHFSFSITSFNKTENYGDGLAFFLQPSGSTLSPDSGGSALGLTNDSIQLNASLNHFVAVEFDIYSNKLFDPTGAHVGIDINSLQSVNNISWFPNIIGGKTNEAWISYNSTTHNLSVTFTNWNQISTFNNSISSIVDLREYLPEWVYFGFSASTGASYAEHEIRSWSFNSTLTDQVAAPAPSPNDVTNTTYHVPPPSGNLNSTHNRESKMPLAVGLSVSAAFLVILFVLFWLFIMHRKTNQEEEEEAHVFDGFVDDEFEKGTGPKKFPYHELVQATNNFDEKLGEGGFGGVYKGFLKDINNYVAVKRVSRGSKQGIKEYAAEVKIISRLRHRNLVQLIGWCHERKELLLVYEFLPNGSLDSHLFKEKSLLTWEARYNIAKGLASGLLYLHEEWEQCVVHRDIKSSNIMLDAEFNAKLGDFGLARLVDHVKGSQTTVLAGTMGYMAPECSTTGKASKESDVYSFGIVCLEIACGRKPIDHMAPKGQELLVKWVWDLYGTGDLLEATDPRLCGEFDAQLMQRLMITGLWCAHPDENLRPSIRQVTHALNFEAPLPILPSKMPVPTYSAPPMNESMLPRSYAGSDSDATNIYSSSISQSTNSSQFTSSFVASSQSVSASFLRTR